MNFFKNLNLNINDIHYLKLNEFKENLNENKKIKWKIKEILKIFKMKVK